MALTYPDPSNPVVIKALTSLIVANDFFLRRVGFVSLGQTNKEVGSCTQVSQSSYTGVVKENTWLAAQLKSFFAFSGGNRDAYIVEAGANDSNKKTETITVSVEADAIKLSKESISLNVGDTLVLDVSAVEAPYKITLPQGNGFLNGSNGTYEVVGPGQLSLNITGMKDESSGKELQLENPITAATLQVTALSAPVTYKNAIANVVNFVNEAVPRLYVLCIPNTLYTQKEVSDIYALTNGVSRAFYVYTESTELSLTDASNIRSAAFKGVKVVYETGEAFRALGTIAGNFASEIFDVSANNPASSQNYKSVAGFNPKELTTTQREQCITNHFDWIGSVGGQQVVMNGRMRSGDTFDYWYQWDLVNFYLTQSITSLLVNSANNPKTGIKYNQNGIDSLQATIETELNKQKSYGTITDFGMGWDTATNVLLGSGKISAQNFSSYISANYSNYQAGIYDGLSFVPMIQRYPQQIIISANLV